MKKYALLFLAVLSSTLISCSKDDENTNNNKYSAQLEKKCRGSITSFCITENEKERLNDLPFTGQACNWVTITDINGNKHSGYLRSFGTANAEEACD